VNRDTRNPKSEIKKRSAIAFRISECYYQILFRTFVQKIFMYLRLLLLFQGFLLLFPFRGMPQEKPTEVILLHVNDMHSKIDNLPKLAYLADSLRKIHPFVFLVSAGDNFTGNPVVDMIPDKGYPMIDLMNRCGFVVSAMGNHEFDMGQTMLQKRLQQANFPFISCNMDASATLPGAIKPYLLVGTSPGDTIAFLGMIQLDDNGLPSAHPANMKGVEFVNGVIKAREFGWLKQKYGTLIGLSHLGIDEDTRLADSMPQFDLIIGGHSHTVIDPAKIENGVMIVQAGAHMKYVGKTTLVIKAGKVVSRKDDIIAFSNLKKEDPGIKTLVSRFNDNPEFARVIGHADKPIEGEDELGSFMTDALTNQLKVDFAFQNRGGIRVSSLSEGPITLKDLYKLDPFNNQVVIFSMKAAEMAGIICYGFQHEKGVDLQVSGMTYRIRTNDKGDCTGVVMTDLNGKPVDPDREYAVAMNNYMAYTYKFDHRDPGTLSTLTTAEAMIRYLGLVGHVNYAGVKRAVAETK